MKSSSRKDMEFNLAKETKVKKKKKSGFVNIKEVQIQVSFGT